MPIQSNDPSHVSNLYRRQDTLSTRIDLHKKYSTNPYGWANWAFDQLTFSDRQHVLELGCGTCAIWADHADRLPLDISILLTDYSPLMLDAARAALGGDPRFSFAQVDIQSIPHPGASFDVVIANHMLYHVPDIDKGLAEAARVLKPGGTFCASTVGERTQWELWELYAQFEDRASFLYAKNSPFTLENGESQLRRHFSRVERRDYPDSLLVTDPGDLLSYIKSQHHIPTDVEPEFDAHVRAAFEPDGAMHITKEQGLFICGI